MGVKVPKRAVVKEVYFLMHQSKVWAMSTIAWVVSLSSQKPEAILKQGVGVGLQSKLPPGVWKGWCIFRTKFRRKHTLVLREQRNEYPRNRLTEELKIRKEQKKSDQRERKKKKRKSWVIVKKRLEVPRAFLFQSGNQFFQDECDETLLYETFEVLGKMGDFK